MAGSVSHQTVQRRPTNKFHLHEEVWFQLPYTPLRHGRIVHEPEPDHVTVKRYAIRGDDSVVYLVDESAMQLGASRMILAAQAQLTAIQMQLHDLYANLDTAQFQERQQGLLAALLEVQRMLYTPEVYDCI